MDAPAILTLPEQKMVQWMPRHLAERYIRNGGVVVNKKVAGLDKNMEPVYHYLVMYNRPRFTGTK
jgi:hypothetical protein